MTAVTENRLTRLEKATEGADTTWWSDYRTTVDTVDAPVLERHGGPVQIVCTHALPSAPLPGTLYAIKTDVPGRMVLTMVGRTNEAENIRSTISENDVRMIIREELKKAGVVVDQSSATTPQEVHLPSAGDVGEKVLFIRHLALKLPLYDGNAKVEWRFTPKVFEQKTEWSNNGCTPVRLVLPDLAFKAIVDSDGMTFAPDYLEVDGHYRIIMGLVLHGLYYDTPTEKVFQRKSGVATQIDVWSPQDNRYLGKHEAMYQSILGVLEYVAHDDVIYDVDYAVRMPVKDA